jgi:hypothetical protein
VRHASFGLIGTLSQGVDGIAAASVFNIDQRFVCGAALAGAVNVVTGPLSGIEAAGAVNVSRGPLSGAQAAGAINVSSGPLSGVQAAGAVNFGRSVRGAQMAGAVNVARTLSGVQMAGAVNFAGLVSGAQLGPVNVAGGPVHGVQIGVVNVAESADFALGVINVATHGRFHVDAWGLPEAGLVFAGVKTGGAHYHYVYAAGIHPVDARPWAALGIGAHITPAESFFVDVDAIAHGELEFNTGAYNSIYQGRLVVGYRLVPGFAVFAGPTYNVLEAHGTAPPSVAPGYAKDIAQTSTERFRGWPGVAVGLEAF